MKNLLDNPIYHCHNGKLTGAHLELQFVIYPIMQRKQILFKNRSSNNLVKFTIITRNIQEPQLFTEYIPKFEKSTCIQKVLAHLGSNLD